MKHVSWLALAGYFAGMLCYFAINTLLRGYQL